MSKPGRSRERRETREAVRTVLDRLPFEYVVDYVVRHYGITQGKGYLRLNVRDGSVVAAEYGWSVEEIVFEETDEVESSAAERDLPSSRRVIKVRRGKKIFALDFRPRRSFTGSLPPHLRSR
jgi:hypothetical protein